MSRKSKDKKVKRSRSLVGYGACNNTNGKKKKRVVSYCNRNINTYRSNEMKFSGSVNEDRLQVERCRDLLCAILPRGLVRSGEVGIAGGFCTDLYRLKQGIVVPQGTGYSDIDVFVSGDGGLDIQNFFLCTTSFIEKGKNAGYKIIREESHEHQYVYEGVAVLIRTITFEGFEESPVSFIQGPKTNNIWQVMKTFDIDVCQVMYDPFKDKVDVLNETIGNHIKEGIFECYPLAMGNNANGVLKCFSIAKVCSSLQRVRKYNGRGFKCKAFPTLVAETDVVSETSNSESEIDSDSSPCSSHSSLDEEE